MPKQEPRVHLRQPKAGEQATTQVPVTVKPKVAVSQTVAQEPTIPVATAMPIASLMPSQEDSTNETSSEALSNAAEAQEPDNVPTPEVQNIAKAVEVDDEDEDEEEADLSLLEPDGAAGRNAKLDEDEPAEVLEGVFEIFKPECLQCKHLVGELGTKKYKDCYWKKGNTGCPAQSTQVMVAVPLHQIIPGWMKYEQAGDYAGVARMAAHLSTKPPYYQKRVHDALNAARIKRQQS